MLTHAIESQNVEIKTPLRTKTKTSRRFQKISDVTFSFSMLTFLLLKRSGAATHRAASPAHAFPDATLLPAALGSDLFINRSFSRRQVADARNVSFLACLFLSCRTEAGSAPLDGGALYLSRSISLLIDRCSFIANVAGLSGGAVRAAAAACAVSRSLFDRNVASRRCGALLSLSCDRCSVLCSNFSRNICRTEASAVALANCARVDLREAVFARNSAKAGGAVAAFASAGALAAAVFCENQATVCSGLSVENASSLAGTACWFMDAFLDAPSVAVGPGSSLALAHCRFARKRARELANAGGTLVQSDSRFRQSLGLPIEIASRLLTDREGADALFSHAHSYAPVARERGVNAVMIVAYSITIVLVGVLLKRFFSGNARMRSTVADTEALVGGLTYRESDDS
jgi:predicted outer membrane repeat protein